MLAGARQFVAAATAALQGALQGALHAVQEPGFLDRAGAGAIGLFVLACWLFSSSSRRPR